jgi:hypothetical protein
LRRASGVLYNFNNFDGKTFIITKSRSRKVSLKAGMLGGLETGKLENLKECIILSLPAFWPHSFPAP